MGKRKIIRHKTTGKPLYVEKIKGGKGVRITSVPKIIREILKKGK